MKRKLIEYKMRYVLGAVFLMLLILLARLYSLQLVESESEKYRTLARENHIRIVPVFAPRGEIFDRDGEKIVANRPIYTVSVNDFNLNGTTYHLFLDRIGADIVQMADQLSKILANDEETVLNFKQISGVDSNDYGADNIKEQIKKHVSKNKKNLENGQSIEIAVVYDPDVAATVREQNLESFGMRLEKETDVLGELVSMLNREGIFEDKTAYQIESQVREIMRENKYRPYVPVMVAEDIPLEMVVTLRERQMEFPGVVVDIIPARNYTYQETLTHVLGYLQTITKDQYEEHKDEGYLLNDLYGQNGLERIHEKYLRGEHGAKQVEVDAKGRPVRDLDVIQPVSGNDLVLTVDLDLQQAAEKALDEGVKRVQNAGHKGHEMARAGAAVVMDVHTGAIRAIASYPAYNPGIFTGGLSVKQWQELQESGALMNRAMSAVYAPGSTFKMATAAAILENNIVDPEYKMPDPGYFYLGIGRFNDWQLTGHGSVDLRKSLEVSCDTYFYKFGLMAGVDAIAHYAREFGLGQKTGINLPGEANGRVPTPEWKYEYVKKFLIMYNDNFARVRELNKKIEETKSESAKQKFQLLRDEELEKRLEEYKRDTTIENNLEWKKYDTVNMTIGQGDNLSTPLQLATYMSAIANDGTVYKPYLVDKIVSPEGQIIKRFGSQVRQKVNIQPKNLKIIQEGIHMVTLPPNGTAAGVFAGFEHSAAAKTGTAEVKDSQDNKIGNHALFVAYTPYEKPEIAVAVVLEYGHSGSGYAGPIARQILDAYYADDQPGTPIEEQESNSDKVTDNNHVSDVQLGDSAENLVNWDSIAAIKWPEWEQSSSQRVAELGEERRQESAQPSSVQGTLPNPEQQTVPQEQVPTPLQQQEMPVTQPVQQQQTTSPQTAQQALPAGQESMQPASSEGVLPNLEQQTMPQEQVPTPPQQQEMPVTQPVQQQTASPQTDQQALPAGQESAQSLSEDLSSNPEQQTVPQEQVPTPPQQQETPVTQPVQQQTVSPQISQQDLPAGLESEDQLQDGQSE